MATIYPQLNVRYTTDDASDTTPSWTTVSNSLIRSISTSRGRDNERALVDAGSAVITITNRNRAFDPVVNAAIGPMNRWYIRAEMSAGVYEDVFLGYAESYQQQWPANGKDAIVVVSCVDEMKVLGLDRLPTLDPPTASSYVDVVKFDDPQALWQFQDPNSLIEIQPAIGSTYLVNGTQTRQATPVLGDWPVENIAGTLYGARSTTGFFYTVKSLDVPTPGLDNGGPGDASGLTAFSYEQWFRSSEATPAANRIIAEGPYDAGSNVTWAIFLTTAGKIAATVRNTTPTNVTATGATSISANTWYHIAMVYNGATVKVYLNGVEDGSAAQTGAVIARGTANPYLSLGRGTPGGTRYYDEVAWYRYAVPVTRLLAHYNTGATLGYPAQAPADRITAVLADSTSNAPTNLNDTIGRLVTPTFKTGQSPLEELRTAEAGEQGVLFIAKDGTVTLLQDGYQGIAPYNSIQATFDDDGTDLKYLDVSVDYSESFLWNEITVARAGGLSFTSTDSTSVSRYLKRTLSIPELEITEDGDVSAIADNLLARYKDPMTRITRLTLTTGHTGIAAAVLPLDIGDLIRVLRTAPGGGTRIDQQVHIQKIQVDANAQSPYWTIVLDVSPL